MGYPTQSTGSWSSWSACSVTCGQGTQRRTKYCKNLSGQFLYAKKIPIDCETQSETRPCSKTACHNGNNPEGSWSSWSACSVTCGQGTQRRTKNCKNHSEQFLNARIIPIDCETESETRP